VPRDVAIADNGEVYVAGYFDGETHVGTAGKFKSAGDQTADAYVVKLGADGKIAWARVFGAARDDAANGVAIKGNNIVVVGNYLDAIKHGEFSKKANGSDDMFIAALDASGEPQWLWTAGGIDSDGANAVVAAPDGGWLVGGSFSDVVTFGSENLKAKGGTDAMLIKLAASGDLEWIKHFGGRYNDKISHLAVDGQGNVYVQGVFRDTAEWGGPPMTAAGSDPDVVLAKYDLNGDHVWSKSFGNPFAEFAGGLTVDRAGYVTMVGSFDRTVSFGEGDEHKSMGESDVYIARFTSSGKFQWARTYGADRIDAASGVAADAAGNTVTTGWFEGMIDFGSGPLKSAGNKDAFAIKLDAKGGLVWAQNWGDKDHDQGRTIAIDGKGQAVAAGIYRFSLSLITPALESKRAEGDRIPKPDAFVLRLDR
jgi:hypothetical protein